MRLTRGGWVLLGFGLTIGVIWAGANVLTLLEERDNGEHITKIERIVTGLKRGHRAPPGGDALQPASHAGQQSRPPKGGHGGKHGAAPPKPHHHPKPPQAPSPVPPAPSPPAAPAAPAQPEPGNSGNGASAEHGVKACVDVAVSACVKAELP